MLQKTAIQCILACILSGLSSPMAAQNPKPAPAQAKPILILGATAHLGNGSTIASSAIGFENGKLTLVADATTIRIDRTKYGKIYDASGSHVWPGMIALQTSLGLSEIAAVRSTRDFAETGSNNANVRAIVAYNADSEIIPTIRSNGILMVQTCPTGGLISGNSAIVQLDAWNWEDAAVIASDGLHLNWPAKPIATGLEENTAADAGKTQDELARFFEEAKAYCAQKAPEPHNLRLEALCSVLEGKSNLYIHVNRAKDIREAVLFAEKYQIKPVLVGAEEAASVVDFLKTKRIALILNSTQSLPAREDSPIDEPFTLPALLEKAGILFAFGGDNFNWRVRNLPFQAGQAVGYGLDHEAAVAAVTLNPARIAKLEQRAGSLEVGKDATLFISEGDMLDMRGCKVTAAFIEGREINLDNKQKALSRKFGDHE